MLPEELLLAIVKRVVQNSEHLHQLEFPNDAARVLAVAQEIHNLSFVNHQFRRIVLPFLFAKFITRSTRRLQQLCKGIQDGTLTFHEFIQTLAFSIYASSAANNDQTGEIIAELLPLLPSVRVVDIRSQALALNQELVSAVNDHKTLQVVKTHMAPQGTPNLEGNFMRKVELGSAHWPLLPAIADLQQRGLGIVYINVRRSPEGLVQNPVQGLKRIHFSIYTPEHGVMPWLQTMIVQHPELEHIQLNSFIDDLGIPFSNQLAPILSKAVIEYFELFRNTRRRPDPSQGIFDEWTTRIVHLKGKESIPVTKILEALMVACPNLREIHFTRASYDDVTQENFISKVVSCFPLLEKLGLGDAVQLLANDGPTPSPPVKPGRVAKRDIDADLTAMRSLATRLAEKLPCLRSVRFEIVDIDDGEGDGEGDDDSDSEYKEDEELDLRVTFNISEKCMAEGGGLELHRLFG